MGPYSGVDYNFTLCPLRSRLQVSNTFTMGIGHGQPYARVDFSSQSGTLDLASAQLRVNLVASVADPIL
jgi:hypothetical protein